MCPEKRISVHEGNRVHFFIRGKGEDLFIVTPKDRLEGEKLKVAIAGRKGNEPKMDIVSFALVDEEPIVVYGDSSESCDERVLLCSQKHARELDKLGIVKFPELRKKSLWHSSLSH
jgi:hypothetical protein